MNSPYIRSGDVDVQRDDVHYLQVPILASAEEFTDFMEALMALIQKFAKHEPGAHRIQRIVSIVTLPEKPVKPD